MDIKQARQLAQVKSKSQKTLAELAKYDYCLTRQYVAGNPNTSAKILLNICFEFLNEVINNPVIPLL